VKSVRIQFIKKRLERNLNNQCYFCFGECVGARWVEKVGRWYNFCDHHHPPELWHQADLNQMFVNDLKEFKWFLDHYSEATEEDRVLFDKRTYVGVV